MKILTHQKTDHALCGEPVKLEEGFSRVKLLTTENMTVDASGLVHGGFVMPIKS